MKPRLYSFRELRWLARPGHSFEKHQKAWARGMTSQFIRDRRMKRQPCEVCGAKAEAHHLDYSDPHAVRWLCRTHHRAEHRSVLKPYEGEA